MNEATPAWLAEAARDDRCDADLFAVALSEEELSGEAWLASSRAVWTLLFRSTPSIASHAAALTESSDARRRALGARVLAGMNESRSRTASNWGRRIFRDQSIPLLGVLSASDPDAGVRATAVAGLGEMMDAAAVPALVVATSDTDEDVRRGAVFGLFDAVDRGVTPAVERVIEVAAADSAAEVRDAAIFVLGTSSQRTAAIHEALRAALDDSDDAVASGAAAGLAERGDAQGAAAMLRLIEEGRLDTSVYVLDELEKLDQTAVDRAVEIARDRGHDVEALEL